MRRGAQGKRRDGNESTIIQALQAVGASVVQLTGADLPDLLVGYCGRNHLFEVKQPKRELRVGQARWHQTWGGTVHVIRDPVDALTRLGIKLRSIT